MASRTALRAFAPLRGAARSFQTSSRCMVEVVNPLPAKKPVGAFRGGLYGFAIGSMVSGGAVYKYVLDEYRISNELLTEDIYSLQAAVQKTHAYAQEMEVKIDELVKKK